MTPLATPRPPRADAPLIPSRRAFPRVSRGVTNAVSRGIVGYRTAAIGPAAVRGLDATREAGTEPPAYPGSPMHSQFYPTPEGAGKFDAFGGGE